MLATIQFIIFVFIITLPLVLYGCDTWCVTSKEEHRLRVFENRVLRRICGPKREEMLGGWGRMCNEELHKLYFSPKYCQRYEVKVDEVGWAFRTLERGEKCIQNFGLET
jgi:hypothetical protein